MMTAAGTANTRFNRATTAHTTMIDKAAIGMCATAVTGATQRCSKMPASMALANAGGIAFTALPKGFQRPAITSNNDDKRNAPTAVENPPGTTPVVANKAAPGVDQATLTGMRVFRLKMIPPRPIAIDNAMRPEAASASLAPTAFSPCTTTAKELAKPTKAASAPAITA